MTPGFNSELIKDNSHYLTKLNCHMLLALILAMKFKNPVILY